MTTYRFRIVALALSLSTTLGVAASSAAPSDDRILPIDSYTSEKGRMLARAHDAALHELNAQIYHCMPWVEIQKESIGFFRPKHLEGDVRYLSINLYIDQQPSPEFAAYSIEERASRMFSRYVGPMPKVAA